MEYRCWKFWIYTNIIFLLIILPILICLSHLYGREVGWNTGFQSGWYTHLFQDELQRKINCSQYWQWQYDVMKSKRKEVDNGTQKIWEY